MFRDNRGNQRSACVYSITLLVAILGNEQVRMLRMFHDIKGGTNIPEKCPNRGHTRLLARLPAHFYAFPHYSGIYCYATLYRYGDSSDVSGSFLLTTHMFYLIGTLQITGRIPGRVAYPPKSSRVTLQLVLFTYIWFCGSTNYFSNNETTKLS